eukprot:CAMPEP_0197853402 /NCGR_PEP_ID=MMETSP1438-20131217/22659_1 /TAXON_ID=1461541 /ORGANISM="Pterosperma sp., Strain CCMP1384" /LENGTH=393 /DNA_ID=CAMNT_0043467805 /DNA_START=312 /DNA_END=1493 /DNA_ORIENTATION=-
MASTFSLSKGFCPNTTRKGTSKSLVCKPALQPLRPLRASKRGFGVGSRRIGAPLAVATEPDQEQGKEKGLTYKDSGVDIDAGAELVRRIAKMCPDVGGFGGLVPFGDSYLVAGTDGVGTKLKLAFDMNKHDTVGIDLVAMSVNDIICCGAKPMFFLDYFATGALDVDVAEQVVSGIVEGCRQSDCQLLGGETAEMPGFYPAGEYDMAGFAVGSMKKDELIDGKSIAPGDVLVGLPSSGVHSNGFSLARKVLEKSGKSLSDPLPGGDGVTIGDALIAPTVIYTRDVVKACAEVEIKGLAHVTGGGFTENLPRVLPKNSGLGISINRGSWPVLPVFKWIQEAGGVDEMEMLRTFNMGIGMVMFISRDNLAQLDKLDIGSHYVLGEVVEGEGVVYP